MLKPDAGEVRFDGHDITRIRRMSAASPASGARSRSRSRSRISPCSRICWSAPSTAAADANADAVDVCGDILERTGSARLRQCAGRYADLARAQAARNGARTRDRSASAPARRNRRRPDRRRMPGTGRHRSRTSSSPAAPLSGSSTSCMRCLPSLSPADCLNFGRKIAEGEPRTVMASRRARNLYGHRGLKA